MPTILEAALGYATAGWHVFPCQPRSKIPATQHGFKDATTDHAQIKAWWADMPDANVAIRTGEESGLFVLDVDDKPGRSLDDALTQFPERLPEDLPTVRTGGGGLQYFFGFPKGRNLSISGGRLGLGIDTRGNGGYVVAPPSIHPHGTTYQWIDSDEIKGLPPTPEWIIAKLEKQKVGALLQSSERLTGGRHDTMVTAAALMRGIGLVTCEIEAALTQMTSRLDLRDGRVVTSKEIHDVAQWVGDRSMGLVNIESVTHGNAVVKAAFTQVAPGSMDLIDRLDAVENPGAFPAHLLTVPGIINDWTTWINAISHKRQPTLALAAVIVACGALIGRRLETESGGRANIYAIGLCETGGGKESARMGVKEVIHAAGAEEVIGPEDWASESGLTASLVHQPALLFQIDEIGKLLACIANPSAGPHLVGIVGALLKLYSSAGSIFKGKAYADSTKNPVIHQPHACLYGTAVPDATWQALGASAVDDGLLARLWTFVADDHTPPRQQPTLRGTPPTALVAAVRTWWEKDPKGMAKVNPTTVVVHRTDEAREIFAAFERQADAEEARLRAQKNPLAKLWTRSVQKADQLSLVYAWSDAIDPIIDGPAARWAVALADYLTRSMVFHIHRHIARNQTEGDLKRVLRLIEDAGEQGVPQNTLTRKTQWLDNRKRKEILESLVEGHQIFSQVVTGASRSTLVWTTAVV